MGLTSSSQDLEEKDGGGGGMERSTARDLEGAPHTSAGTHVQLIDSIRDSLIAPVADLANKPSESAQACIKFDASPSINTPCARTRAQSRLVIGNCLFQLMECVIPRQEW